MRFETFSYLPAMSETEREAQIASLLARGLIPAIEYHERPRPRDHYWRMWNLPMFEARSAGEVIAEIDACAAEHPDAYIKVLGYDSTRQGQSAFVVRRPSPDGAVDRPATVL
jgi:ribulose-bisphosphate carboxylase small chain